MRARCPGPWPAPSRSAASPRPAPPPEPPPPPRPPAGTTRYHSPRGCPSPENLGCQQPALSQDEEHPHPHPPAPHDERSRLSDDLGGYPTISWTAAPGAAAPRTPRCAFRPRERRLEHRCPAERKWSKESATMSPLSNLPRAGTDAMDLAEADDRPPHGTRDGASCPNLPQRPRSGRSAREETLIFRASPRRRSRPGAPLWQIWTRPRPGRHHKPHPPHSDDPRITFPNRSAPGQARTM